MRLLLSHTHTQKKYYRSCNIVFGKKWKQNTTIRNNQFAFQENNACQTHMIFIPEYIFFFHEAEIMLCRQKPETQKTCKINWPL